MKSIAPKGSDKKQSSEARKWGIGIQGDKVVLFRAQGGEGPFRTDENYFEDWDNGQQAAKLTRLLTLIHRHEDRP